MASGVGPTLRKARTDRGIELSEVERATKIRLKFLEAMEEDRWEELPAPAYARGFLDIYARYLGVDREALLDQYSKTVEGEGGGHEPIPGSVIKPGTLRQHRPVKRAGSIRRSSSIQWGPVGKVAAGLLAIVVVGLIIVGSIGGSDNNGNGKPQKQKHGNSQAAGKPTSTATTTPTVAAGQVSVELRSTAGETLTADEKRGPFSATGFDVTFGNGSVELMVDGEAQQVPQLAEPLGYRITPTGVHRLDPSSQPTCT
jgi:cytoskeletal protein RodZ